MANETLSMSNFAGLEVTKVEQRTEFMNLAFYGDSGIGKTTLAGSASVVEGMYPVLDIDLEGGSESLRRTYPNVEVVRVKNINQLQDVYSALYDGKHPYKTVLLDSGSEVQNFSMSEIMRQLVEREPDRDPDLPGYREYGKNLNQMRTLVRGFRDLDLHTIITCLNKAEKNQNTGVTLMQPKFTGQFALEFSALMDVVLYYYMKTVVVDGESVVKRLLLSTKTDTVVAKDRTGKLPQIIEEPTMQKIFDYFKERPQTSEDTKSAPAINVEPTEEVSESTNAMEIAL